MANHERLSNRNFWYFGHDSVWMGQTSGSGEMLTFWVDYSTRLPCFLIGILIHNGYILFNKTLMLTKCWMLIARVSVVAHRHFMFCFTSQIQCDINKFVKSQIKWPNFKTSELFCTFFFFKYLAKICNLLINAVAVYFFLSKRQYEVCDLCFTRQLHFPVCQGLHFYM